MMTLLEPWRRWLFKQNWVWGSREKTTKEEILFLLYPLGKRWTFQVVISALQNHLLRGIVSQWLCGKSSSNKLVTHTRIQMTHLFPKFSLTKRFVLSKASYWFWVFGTLKMDNVHSMLSGTYQDGDRWIFLFEKPGEDFNFCKWQSSCYGTVVGSNFKLFDWGMRLSLFLGILFPLRTWKWTCIFCFATFINQK